MVVAVFVEDEVEVDADAAGWVEDVATGIALGGPEAKIGRKAGEAEGVRLLTNCPFCMVIMYIVCYLSLNLYEPIAMLAFSFSFLDAGNKEKRWLSLSLPLPSTFCTL